MVAGDVHLGDRLLLLAADETEADDAEREHAGRRVRIAAEEARDEDAVLRVAEQTGEILRAATDDEVRGSRGRHGDAHLVRVVDIEEEGTEHALVDDAARLRRHAFTVERTRAERAGEMR